MLVQTNFFLAWIIGEVDYLGSLSRKGQEGAERQRAHFN